MSLREEESLEPLREAWRRGDEMRGTRRDQAPRVESDGQGIADALDPRRVIARDDQGRDCGFANRRERRTGLAGDAAAVRAPKAVGHRSGGGPVLAPRRARHAEKRPQHLWIGVETVPQHGVPDPLEALNL